MIWGRGRILSRNSRKKPGKNHVKDVRNRFERQIEFEQMIHVKHLDTKERKINSLER